MTPDFELRADGDDVTAMIRDRLISLTVTDEEGLKADKLSFELDDRGNLLAVPPAEAQLELSLGFRETGLTRIGTFVVERRSGRGMPDTMSIDAKAADMSSQIRAPKTRAWENVTLGEMVETIAGEANLTPTVGEDIAPTFYTYVAQTAESDLHLLTRLAAVLDATAKPADGRLVVVRRGTGTAADGTALPVIALLKREFRSYDWALGERGKYKSVTAEWSETGTATLHKVTVGSGKPERRLRHPFGSQDEAQRAAQAALDRAERGNTSVSGELGGFWPGLFAGGLVEFPDLRAELGGRFHLRSVTHVLMRTLTTRFEAEIAGPKE
ncbi:hypothetical protein SAMN05421853_102125 [Roseivivax halotolerans]|uniref:Phage protein D n=1 Tax=Roseivivax halotolerans TaxID=93684 RepID=A0A1I5W4V7_9RHOB|nr:contractile injection system protein, VgrG/Pvc8 family [Roseivivax halotolerans]SFQ14703.1 hypothetical protein SAMN05421853_102125 [Roseivivax halotolerans]